MKERERERERERVWGGGKERERRRGEDKKYCAHDTVVIYNVDYVASASCTFDSTESLAEKINLHSKCKSGKINATGPCSGALGIRI